MDSIASHFARVRSSFLFAEAANYLLDIVRLRVTLQGFLLSNECSSTMATTRS